MSVWVRPLNQNRQAFIWLQWRTKLSQKCQSFLTTDATPHFLALSFALGTFISLAPTPGLNTVLTIMLMTWFRQLPRVGLIAAMAVWNIFVVTPIYAVGYRLGIHLFAETAVPEATHFLGQLTSLSKGFFLGNMITAVVVAIFCYLAVYGLLTVKKVRLSQ